MSKIINSLIAAVLASAAFSAIADTGAVPASSNDNGTIVIAQAKATKDYQKYLDRMMDKSTMEMLDANGDGEITRHEFMQFHNAVFDTMDQNKDDKITKDEEHKTLHPDG